MTFKSTIYLGLLAMVSLSCGNADTVNDDPLFGMVTPPTIVAPYKRLMKEVETANGVISREKNFVYEDKKLVGINTSDNSFSEVITYTEDLITKVVKKENFIANTITTTSLFVYNTAKVVTHIDITQTIEDVSSVNTYYGTTDLTYTGNKLTKAVTNYKLLGNNGVFTPTLTVTSEWTYMNGNVVDCTKTTHDYIANITGTVVTSYANYDTKKSLYNALPFQYNFYSQLSEGLSTNNPRSVTDPSGTTNYTYGYDGDSPLSRSNGTKTTQFQYSVF